MASLVRAGTPNADRDWRFADERFPLREPVARRGLVSPRREHATDQLTLTLMRIDAWIVQT
jgi:hypothetical protein